MALSGRSNMPQYPVFGGSQWQLIFNKVMHFSIRLKTAKLVIRSRGTQVLNQVTTAGDFGPDLISSLLCEKGLLDEDSFIFAGIQLIAGRRFGGICSMACLTGSRTRLVKQYIFTFYRLLQSMTSRTGHILVAALKRKCSLFVVEEGWPPLVTVMACSAVASFRPELVTMRIFVTFAASFRRALELNVKQRQLHIRRLVTIAAGHGTMRTNQRKFRSLMVELG